jgi:FlaG/FlaF family flagellin (archaellin)
MLEIIIIAAIAVILAGMLAAFVLCSVTRK